MNSQSENPIMTKNPTADMSESAPISTKLSKKDEDLELAATSGLLSLTTNVGQPISTDQNSLKAGLRGPTLLEDFVLREKIQHFDHERIPERIVHARGAAAHGFFELYESLSDLTTAKVLNETGVKTPVFTRFSTVAGSRGSADTARDVRGFAVKLYTSEGNWDIVGNNIPVFFIQDAIKFPDLIHAAKPEPHNEIPQAQTAHDTFWDFISLTPESMHMIMWVMSDRGIPRSFNLMEGFGVHTFRLVNGEGKSTFVKFHWKPVLGLHSLVWDEALKIAGKDPDFHRRSMWESISDGKFYEWELGIQTLSQEDEQKFDFDILDATKLWPEEILPVKIVGKMTLNRNPDNYFSETEQVAFNVTNLPPGVDLSDDPLLQGRTFSYLDTQLSRLGSPNFTELPINRPLNTVSNNQRDAQMRTTINKGRVSYAPASLDDHDPDEVTPSTPGFVSYPEEVNGPKVRVRSATFGDHFGQAKLFWNSMTPIEKEHIAKALQFELGHVETRKVRQRMIANLEKINPVLAAQVAAALGEKDMASVEHVKPSGTSDSALETQVLGQAKSETSASGGAQSSDALSIEKRGISTPKGRKVAILVEAGVNSEHVSSMLAMLDKVGAKGEIVGPHLGAIDSTGATVEATKTYAGTSSVLYDALCVPGGESVELLHGNGDAKTFIAEAYKHGKAIHAFGDSAILVQNALPVDIDHAGQSGVFLTDESHDEFVEAIGKRHWGRAALDQVAV